MDYRAVPENLKPARPADRSSAPETADVDGSLLGIVTHWRLVIVELAERGIDLYDPAVLNRPWPGVRTVIFSLLSSDTRLRAALTRR